MKSSKKLYVILNDDETLYLNNDKPMIYRKLENFISNERYKGCKVAVFDVTEIKTIAEMKDSESL